MFADDFQGVVAKAAYETCEVDTAKANARLIAAAPDLLAALKEMRDACAAAMRALSITEGSSGAFVVELKAANIPDGFGKRADDLIRRIEGEAQS